ncbi:hypothetical protein OE09_0061 [Flavobacteriaceae bacterium MAR_2010_72]|nr:hypothetical protein OE09_0061 [Flavobacteriaceae bacterium MAR_2010_72]
MFTTVCSISMFVFLSSFSQCTDKSSLQDEAPVAFGDVYYQYRAQAVRDLESSFTLVIPIKEDLPSNITLDSVYFKGKSAKLQITTNKDKVYFAKFITKPAHNEDIILSSDMADERKNKLPEPPVKMPFELEPNECIISYTQDGITKYFKIKGITQRRLKDVPMSSKNKP